MTGENDAVVNLNDSLERDKSMAIEPKEASENNLPANEEERK